MNTIHQGVITEIACDIRNIEQNTALYEETNFDNRANAIDFIDFHIIDRIGGLQQQAEHQNPLNELKRRAEALKDRLEQLDINLFKKIRREIAGRIYNGSSFKDMVGKYLGRHLIGTTGTDTAGYDNLDVFINGLLTNQPLPEGVAEPEAEMVFYQKTPARIVFEMAERAQLIADDVFFDIGSGLGQAAILVNLLSSATAIGVEYEPAYCDYARACAAWLNLPGVRFINTDAREADYSGGTVFFLYTPFEGSVLQEMLYILQEESRKRAITVFTYGPCSSRVAIEKWLSCINGDGNTFYKLYEFRSLDTPFV